MIDISKQFKQANAIIKKLGGNAVTDEADGYTTDGHAT